MTSYGLSSNNEHTPTTRPSVGEYATSSTHGSLLTRSGSSFFRAHGHASTSPRRRSGATLAHSSPPEQPQPVHALSTPDTEKSVFYHDTLEELHYTRTLLARTTDTVDALTEKLLASDLERVTLQKRLQTAQQRVQAHEERNAELTKELTRVRTALQQRTRQLNSSNEPDGGTGHTLSSCESTAPVLVSNDSMTMGMSAIFDIPSTPTAAAAATCLPASLLTWEDENWGGSTDATTTPVVGSIADDTYASSGVEATSPRRAQHAGFLTCVQKILSYRHTLYVQQQQGTSTPILQEKIDFCDHMLRLLGGGGTGVFPHA